MAMQSLLRLAALLASVTALQPAPASRMNRAATQLRFSPNDAHGRAAICAISAAQPAPSSRATTRLHYSPVDALSDSMVVLDQPLVRTFMLAAAVDVVAQGVRPHEPAAPPRHLPRAQLRHRRRDRRISAATAIGFASTSYAACEYLGLGANEAVLFILAAGWNGFWREMARLREVDRCIAELRDVVTELRRAAPTAGDPVVAFERRADAAEAAYADLARLMSEGPFAQ